jgi:hypothetical protein
MAAACLLAAALAAMPQPAAAQAASNQPVYRNAAKQGPEILVIPGEVKCASAEIAKSISAANVADFAAIELMRANFVVLDRGNIGTMLKEIELAVNLGDPNKIKSLRKGAFKNTKWLVRFDILRIDFIGRQLDQKKWMHFNYAVGLSYKLIDMVTGVTKRTNFFEVEWGYRTENQKPDNSLLPSVVSRATQVLLQHAVAELDSMK